MVVICKNKLFVRTNSVIVIEIYTVPDRLVVHGIIHYLDELYTKKTKCGGKCIGTQIYR